MIHPKSFIISYDQVFVKNTLDMFIALKIAIKNSIYCNVQLKKVGNAGAYLSLLTLFAMGKLKLIRKFYSGHLNGIHDFISHWF